METNEIPGMFEGPIIPTTIKIGMPILLANAINFVYMLVDTFFISLLDHSSTAILSGTGLLFPFFFLFMAIGASISVGVSALVGRTIGEKNIDAAKSILVSGLTLAFAIGIPSIFIGYYWGENIIGMLAGNKMTPEALTYGLQYFYFILPGFLILIISYVFSGVIHGEGLTQVIANAVMISTVINIILDPLMIFGLKLGVIGAGLATSISSSYLLIHFMRFIISGKTTIPMTFNFRKTRFVIIKEISRIGFPHFLMMGIVSISIVILNKLVGNIGEHYMNAWTIVGRIDQLVLIPAMAVASASLTMISQNYGRNQLDRVKKIYMTNLGLAAALVSIIALIYYFLAPVLFPMFSSVAEVVDAAVFQVRWVSITFVGLVAPFMSSTSFQATGKPYPAVLIPLFRVGLIIIPLSSFLTSVVKLEMNGVYIALAAGNLGVFPFAFFWTRFHLKRLTFEEVL